MAQSISVPIPPTRKANFAQANFELKLLVVIFLVMTFGPLVVLDLTDHTSNFLSAIILPGSSIVYVIVIRPCFQSIIGNQDLKTQLQLRLQLIFFLLLAIAFAYWKLPHFTNMEHLSAPVYQKACFYRPIYNICLPGLLILILLIRTIPMTVKFYNLKNDKA